MPEAPAGPVRRSVLANFGALAASTLLSQLLNFLLIVYVARVLGREAFGAIALAQGIVLYGRLATDMGFDMLGSRRVAADPPAAATVVADLAGARLANAVVVLAVLGLGAAVAPASPVSRLVVLFGLGLLPIAGSLEWVFSGLERMEFVGGSRLVAAAVWLGLVVALVRAPADAVYVPLAYVAGLAIASAGLVVAARRAVPGARVRFSLGGWRSALAAAVPLGAAFIVNQVYVGFGTLALGAFDGTVAVGTYAAANRVVLLLLSLAALFGAAIYPRLVALHGAGRPELERAMALAARLTTGVAIPLAAGGTMVADRLIPFLYGSGYAECVIVLQVVVWSVVTVFGNVPYAFALLAAGRKRAYLAASVSGAVVNIAANLLLIPRFHLLGPAVATLCSELVVFAMLLTQSRRVGRISPFAPFAPAVAASAVMVLALWTTRGWPFLAQVAVGTCVYVACWAAFGGIRRDDLAQLASSADRG